MAQFGSRAATSAPAPSEASVETPEASIKRREAVIRSRVAKSYTIHNGKYRDFFAGQVEWKIIEKITESIPFHWRCYDVAKAQFMLNFPKKYTATIWRKIRYNIVEFTTDGISAESLQTANQRFGGVKILCTVTGAQFRDINHHMIDLWYDDRMNIYVPAINLLILRNTASISQPAIFEAQLAVPQYNDCMFNRDCPADENVYKGIANFIRLIEAYPKSGPAIFDLITAEKIRAVIGFSRVDKIEAVARDYMALFNALYLGIEGSTDPTMPMPTKKRKEAGAAPQMPSPFGDSAPLFKRVAHEPRSFLDDMLQPRQ